MKADKENKVNSEKELTGTVVRKKFGQGSKSEHDAVCLESASGSFVLRRMGGNPFNDPELNKLVGKEVTATGRFETTFFMANTIREL